MPDLLSRPAFTAMAVSLALSLTGFAPPARASADISNPYAADVRKALDADPCADTDAAPPAHHRRDSATCRSLQAQIRGLNYNQPATVGYAAGTPQRPLDGVTQIVQGLLNRAFDHKSKENQLIDLERRYHEECS